MLLRPAPVPEIIGVRRGRCGRAAEYSSPMFLSGSRPVSSTSASLVSGTRGGAGSVLCGHPSHSPRRTAWRGVRAANRPRAHATCVCRCGKDRTAKRFPSDGAYRDRTGDLRLAKPVPGESAEVGSEGESADLAGDSEPPLTGATGSNRRESDRAVGQAWDDAGPIDDDPRSQRGPSDDSSTQPEVAGDEPSG
jgi:hypothetical protein